MRTITVIFFAGLALMQGCVSDKASNAATKTHTLPSWGNGAPRLKMTTPPGFEMNKVKGPDFDVFYFSDAATNMSMGVYIGDHPSLRSRQSSAPDLQRHPGSVGGVPVEWLVWSQGGVRRSETLVRKFYGQDASKDYTGLILHIFISARTEEEVSMMEAAASTLRRAK